MRVYSIFLCLASLIPMKASAVCFTGSLCSPRQVTGKTPSKATGPADVAQLALDQKLYFALKLTVDTAGAQMRSEQQDYFSGMLAFHEGHFEEARQHLSAALNARDTMLTSEQKIQAFETLGRNARLTGNFAGCAQMFEDIDKIWGARLGEADRDIRQNRHLCVAQMGNPPQTIDFTTQFTIQRTQGMYPVHVGNVSDTVQLDTGADETVLIESTAKKWGIVPSTSSVVMHGYSGGEFSGHPGVIPSLSIGTATLRNIPVLIVPDEDLLIAQLHLQIRVLLGLPVLQSLGSLTFKRDGSLTVSPSSFATLPDGASLWLGDSQLLVQVGTLPGTQGFHFGGPHEPRLFVLDTGSGSSYLTDHYFQEHPQQFQGSPPETAKLAGAGGEVDIPAYAARSLPLWFGPSEVVLNGQHVIPSPLGNETEHFEGLLGQDVLATLTSYTIDLRGMRFIVQP
jgi:predicted aspartyl protease